MTIKLPPMVTMESSNIAAIGHNPQDKTLFVRFKNGGMYSYTDVPETTYHAMLGAQSPGAFHAEKIKGVFEHRRR